MAPRGPRSQSSRAGRETRNSTLNAKSSSSSGIQKKKGGPAKVDGDGDLDMDSAAARGSRGSAASAGGTRSRPSTRSTPATHTRGASKAAQSVIKHLNNGDSSNLASRIANPPRSRGHLTFLRVHGLKASKAASNPDGGLKDLLAFLERKSSSLAAGNRKRNVMIKKSHVAGDYVFIGASKEDAEELLKVNTFTFAGAPLEIVESIDDLDELASTSRATESKDTQELRTKLQAILSQRYIGGSKLLKLDALASDSDLVGLGMFENRDRALKTFKGLMAICDSLFKTPKEKQEAIESISLANNNIDDVAQVEKVATTFPQLQNLDMSGNQIRTMQGLQRWKGKFKALVTIFTNGNPIETTDPNFQTSLLQWFPKLQYINGAQLRTPEQIAQQAEAKRPKPIPQNGPDFRDINRIGENFLLDFFASFDTDRQGLASRLYDENSHFSLSVDASSVRDANAPPPLSWTPYMKESRNCKKINSTNARIQRLKRGNSSIAALWGTIPFTRHPSIKEDLSKYIMDCHPLSGLADPNNQNQAGVDGLIICVHGEYDEHDPKSGSTGKRSFSRTFVLGPGQQGKSDIRVISDMLSLRAYSRLPNVFETQGQDQHQAMIGELSRQTGMVPHYSEICLVEVGWDFDKALVVFNENKGSLPSDAFATASQ